MNRLVAFFFTYMYYCGNVYTRVAYTWPRAHFFLIYMLEPFVLLHNKHMSNNACSISWQNCLLHPLPLVTLYNNTFEFVLYATPNPSETTTRMHKKYQMSIIAMYNNQQPTNTTNTKHQQQNDCKKLTFAPTPSIKQIVGQIRGWNVPIARGPIDRILKHAGHCFVRANALPQPP